MPNEYISPPNMPPGYAQSGTSVAAGTHMDGLLRPTGALAETIPRHIVGSNLAAVASGILRVFAIPIESGKLITSISFMSGSTALGTGTNQWFVITDNARVRLGITSDDTNAAWAADTVKTLNLATPFTTTYAGLYYVGYMVAAGTPPSVRGFSTSAIATALVPVTGGNSSTGLTDPASCPATIAAIGATANIGYAYVS